MKLYTSVASAPGRSVSVFCDLEGIKVEEINLVLPKMEQKSPEHMARNPHGKVPVLEVSEGVYIYESVAIIQYLLENHTKDSKLAYSTPQVRH